VLQKISKFSKIFLIVILTNEFVTNLTINMKQAENMYKIIVIYLSFLLEVQKFN